MVEFLERTWWAFALLLFITLLSVMGVASREGEPADSGASAQVAASSEQQAAPSKPRPKPKRSRPASPPEGEESGLADSDEALIDSADGEDTTPAEERAAAAPAAPEQANAAIPNEPVSGV